jgi:hypothetical protein
MSLYDKLAQRINSKFYMSPMHTQLTELFKLLCLRIELDEARIAVLEADLRKTRELLHNVEQRCL